MKLTGIAAWAFLTKPKPATKTKKGIIDSMYTVNLILDVKTAKKLKADGFNIKRIQKEVPGIDNAVGKPFIQIKKPAEYDGTPTTPPEVVDSQLKPFTGLIGNGSKISVVFAAKEWEGFGTTGIAAKLRKAQILDLVSYIEDEDLEEFEVTQGFVSEDAVAISATAEVKEVADDGDIFDGDDDLDF